MPLILFSDAFSVHNVPATAPTPSSQGPVNGILLVEEYGALATAITAALKKFAPHHGVRVARTLAEAEAAAAAMRPELFVLDLDPPPAGDIDFFNKIQSRFPEARVLVVAAGTSPELRAERGTAGAVQFIEKPFDLGEFGAAVQALLGPWAVPPSHSFRGTLRELHVIDIVQLKCLALSSAVVRLETPAGKVGEIHFHYGRISHAWTGELSGVPAFEEIVRWPGGKLSETEMPPDAPETIDRPWAVLLLQAVRKATENETPQTRDQRAASTPPLTEKRGKTILVIDDTEMLLIFTADVLETADKTFHIVTALTGREGLEKTTALRPDLILLDYSLTDTTGAEVCRRLLENEGTARIPVLMMSGHLPELANTAAKYKNVVATLPKPFLSGALINSVEKILATGPLLKEPVAPPAPQPPSNATPPNEKDSQGAAENADLPAPPTPRAAPAPSIPEAPRTASSKTFTLPVAEAAAVKEVSVTFSLEVLSMQLTPDFRTDSFQLTPAEAPVKVHVADGGETGMLVETGFRLGPAQLGSAGQIERIILFPTAPRVQPSGGGTAFTVSAVRAKPGPESRLLELTATKNESMRVQLIAQFELIAVELSPTFEVVAVVLRARNSAVHLGTDPGKAVAPFQIAQVQLDARGRLSELFVRASR